MGLTSDFRRERPCRDGCAYFLCWDNDGTKSGTTARSDVTRLGCGNLLAGRSLAGKDKGGYCMPSLSALAIVEKMQLRSRHQSVVDRNPPRLHSSLVQLPS